MKLYHKAFLYRHKWIQPYLQKVLGGIDAVTFLAALALIIEYFTLSDSNSRHFFRTGIGGIEIFLVIFKQPYFSADSVVVTFLIALIFGGDRTLGKTDQSLPDSGRKFLPYYLYRHRFVDVTSLYR